MITFRDVWKRNHPLTANEYSIISAAWIAGIAVAGVAVLLICLLCTDCLREVLEAFFALKGVVAALGIWLLLVVYIFLSGVFYIRRHNKAIEYGTCSPAQDALPDTATGSGSTAGRSSSLPSLYLRPLQRHRIRSGRAVCMITKGRII